MCIGLLLALASSGCASGPRAAFGSGLPQVAASADVRQQEQEMFQLLNRDRAALGLPPLKYDERLADVARYHSADMRDHQFFEHDSPNSGSLDDRLNAAGYLFLSARENLSEAPDVKRSQEGLMQSPPHHENIMATDVTHVGVGIVEGGVVDPRNLTVTQVFSKPGREESAAEARGRIERAIHAARSDQGLSTARTHPVLQELAEKYLSELGDGADEGRVQDVGQALTQELAERRLSDVSQLAVGAQLLPDSTLLQVPQMLSTSKTARFGLAVRSVRGDDNRPMLQVLLIVGDE